jgi:hypothetical protein
MGEIAGSESAMRKPEGFEVGMLANERAHCVAVFDRKLNVEHDVWSFDQNPVAPAAPETGLCLNFGPWSTGLF